MYINSILPIYCQNPNSTNSSVQQSLRLDYILTERSTPPTPTTQTQLVYSKLDRAAQLASRDLSLQLNSYTQTSVATLYYNRLAAEL